DGLSVKLGDKLIEKSIEETFDLESLDSVSEEDNPEATIDYEEKNPLADDIAESLRLPPAEEVLRQLSEESEMHLSAAREQAGSDVDSETETSPQNEEIPDADIVETDNSEADEIIDAINVEDTPLPDETSDEIESESTLSEAEPDDEQESRSEAPDEEEIETPEISSRDETGELVSALLEENIEPEVQKSETEQTQYAQTPPEQAKENIEEKTEELEYASETSPNEQQDIETTDSDDNQIKETAAEIMLEETETPKETFFTKIKSQLGRIFSKSQKKEEEELPLLDGDGPVLEQEASEEQIDETAPEEVLQEEEPAAPEPAPEEPVEQKDEIEDDDDDDEALLNEEEFEKLKIKPVQQTIIERTTINTSSVFATIFVILMFVAGGSGLVYKVFFDQSELQVLYSKADKSINSENPEIDKATEYANGYQTTLGANSAKQSESFIAASWANHLRESSGESEKASILLKIFRGQNIRSRVLDEELVKTLIAQCGSAIKTGNTAKAKQYFKEATDILQEGLVLEGQAHSYRKQLAKLGYLLNSQTVTDSLARKDLDSAHAALKGMLSLEKYLTQKEANDIDNITQRTANQLINEAQSAYNKRDYALAAKLAGQALDLTAGNTKAKNILVRARARLK
ncbi:MAG TPA: hypothetical protein PLN69_12465, partial [bacterium]|nr:hypothetical protein [bacterium]